MLLNLLETYRYVRLFMTIAGTTRVRSHSSITWRRHAAGYASGMIEHGGNKR